MNGANGRKDDGGKDFAAIPYQEFPHALREVVKVATFGARKYVRGNWVHVENAQERYEDALHRHLLAHHGGEKHDAESGLTHLAHAAWNMLALLEMAETRVQCNEGVIGVTEHHPTPAASAGLQLVRVRLTGVDLSNNGHFTVYDELGNAVAQLSCERTPPRSLVLDALADAGHACSPDITITYGNS